MKEVCTVTFKPGTREELLPDFDPAFPLITTCCGLQKGGGAPWHWHKAVELFYMESGALEYLTPSGACLFPEGSGGFVNSNVLHATAFSDARPQDRQLLHLFDPSLISGAQGSRMEEKYVLPLTTAPQVEILRLLPEDPRQGEILELLRKTFQLSPEEPGYELRLRSLLSEIWMGLLEVAAPLLAQEQPSTRASQQLKDMMVFIHEHYGEKLTVTCIAQAAHISERTCYALFKNHLRTTPLEYLTDCRLRMACTLLSQTEFSVTDIAASCALGSSSYFSRLFRRFIGMTPLEYRKKERETSP